MGDRRILHGVSAELKRKYSVYIMYIRDYGHMKFASSVIYVTGYLKQDFS